MQAVTDTKCKTCGYTLNVNCPDCRDRAPAAKEPVPKSVAKRIAAQKGEPKVRWYTEQELTDLMNNALNDAKGG